MRNFVFAATLIFAGCGSASMPVGDLSVVVEPDLSLSADLAASPIDASLPDFAFSLCTMPKAGIYNETVQYQYVPVSGGPSTFASSGSTVVIKNDGSYIRPSTVFGSPDRYHCLFTNVDAVTCFAACCPGQPSSPTMYFDGGGWTMWMGGACSFQTTTGSQYIANIASVEAYFTR